MSTSPTQEGGDEGEDVTYPEWIHVQKKTFTNWVNEKLKGTSYRVDDLEKDLDDGVTLIKLLETLANKKMHKRYSLYFLLPSLPAFLSSSPFPFPFSPFNFPPPSLLSGIMLNLNVPSRREKILR